MRPGWQSDWKGRQHLGYTYLCVGEGTTGTIKLGNGRNLKGEWEYWLDAKVIAKKFGDQGNLCITMRFNGVTETFEHEAQLWVERALASLEAFEAEMVLQALGQYEALKP